MRELKLQNSCLTALVDDEDYNRLSKFVWYINNNSTIHRTYRVWQGGSACNVALASEIMHQPRQRFDHKDRNLLNNRKENLRPCTQAQNCANRTKRKNTSSIYKGVVFNRSCRKWEANVNKDGVKYYLGLFKNEKDAALAYNDKAKELFGEFANLNSL